MQLRLSEPIEFEYVNHRGERSKRRVYAHILEFKTIPEYYPQPQWLLTGHDEGKNAVRTFALSRIVVE